MKQCWNYFIFMVACFIFQVTKTYLSQYKQTRNYNDNKYNENDDNNNNNNNNSNNNNTTNYGNNSNNNNKNNNNNNNNGQAEWCPQGVVFLPCRAGQT